MAAALKIDFVSDVSCPWCVIINDQYLIQGGQPVEVFEQVLRKIASQ